MNHRRSLDIKFILTLAIVFALSACGGTMYTATPATPTETATQSPSPTTAPQEHFKVGDVVTDMKTWEITVLKVATSKGSEYDQPKAGNHFLVITVKLKNISQEEQHVSSDLQFTLRDTEGYQYTESYLDSAKPSPGGKVEAGGLVSGDLVYDVPVSMHQFTLSFESNIFQSGQAIWDISA